MASKLRFFYNGIKVVGDSKLIKAFAMISEKGWTGHAPGTISVYAKGYRHFPEAVRQHFVVENATDSQTDYFEEDHFKVAPGHPLYAAVKEGMIDAKEKHFAKRESNKQAKLREIFVKTGGTLAEEKPSPVKVVVEGVAEIIKGFELKAKGLEVAAEYLRLYGVQEDEVASETSEPTYLDLYEI